MIKRKKWIKIICVILFSLLICYSGFKLFKTINFNYRYEVGQVVDSLNHVYVYHNGGVDNVEERNLAGDGYNIGLKYQCVEFVKRYYYEHLKHKMPDTYGHAKSFFDKKVEDGQFNTQRNLLQFTNGSNTKPQIGDLIVFKGTLLNMYGHVAIVSNVSDNSVEIIQQNPGSFSPSRESFDMKQKDSRWKIENKRISGWLRKDNEQVEPNPLVQP